MKEKTTFSLTNSEIIDKFKKTVASQNKKLSFAVEEAMKLWIQEEEKKEKKD